MAFRVADEKLTTEPPVTGVCNHMLFYLMNIIYIFTIIYIYIA